MEASKEPLGRRILGRPGLLVVALVALALGAAVPIAWASDRFTDVPTTNPHHDDINTIARAGITLGCNPPGNTLYCPTDPVTRQQMGSFLARTLRALTPVHLQTTSTGAIDFDVSPNLCATPAHTPTVAEHAKIDSWVSALQAASGEMNFGIATVFSTDNGATWSFLVGENFARAGDTVGGVWSHASRVGRMDLSPGTTYRFGVRALRISGTVDASDSRCHVFATVTYRDAGASTLGTSATVTNDADSTR